MTERILDLSEGPARLSVNLGRLVIKRGEETVTMPISELAVLVVSHPAVSYTHAVLAGLCAEGGAVVLCNEKRLPVGTKEARNNYTRFRKLLLREGFMKIQFSVYARYCASEERGESFRRRIRKAVPPEGEVRLMSITDRQFGKMEVYQGKKRAPTEKPPEQIMLF